MMRLEVIHPFLSHRDHLVADIDAGCVFEVGGEAQDYLPRPYCQVQVLMALSKGLEGVHF